MTTLILTYYTLFRASQLQNETHLDLDFLPKEYSHRLGKFL